MKLLYLLYKAVKMKENLWCNACHMVSTPFNRKTVTLCKLKRSQVIKAGAVISIHAGMLRGDTRVSKQLEVVMGPMAH